MIDNVAGIVIARLQSRYSRFLLFHDATECSAILDSHFHRFTDDVRVAQSFTNSLHRQTWK